MTNLTFTLIQATTALCMWEWYNDQLNVPTDERSIAALNFEAPDVKQLLRGMWVADYAHRFYGQTINPEGVEPFEGSVADYVEQMAFAHSLTPLDKPNLTPRVA